MEKNRKEQANIDARIHAIGWSGLMNSFKKDTDTPIDFVDLLPFPEEIKDNEARISDRTRKVIEQMMRDKQFPVPILSALSLLLK